MLHVQVLQGRRAPYLHIPGKFLRFILPVLLRSHLPVNQSLWWWWGEHILTMKSVKINFQSWGWSHKITWGKMTRRRVFSREIQSTVTRRQRETNAGRSTAGEFSQLFSVFLAGLNVIRNVKHVTPCLAQRRCPVNMSLVFQLLFHNFMWHVCVCVCVCVCVYRLPRWLSGWRTLLQCRRFRFSPWVGKIPWRRAWQLTPVFLPREFHGWRSVVGYSP